MPVKVKSTSPRSVVSRPTNRNQVALNQSNLLRTVDSLSDLADVDTSDAVDGSVLVYDEIEEKFLATTLLDKQIINGGHF
jgi:hypothetical protein